MIYKLNIGINGTSYSNIMEQLNNGKGYHYDSYHTKLGDGHYKGMDEPTAVITIDSTLNNDSITTLMKTWCKRLNQDCIAYKDITNDVGHLIYNENYKGDTDTYNSNYFID